MPYRVHQRIEEIEGKLHIHHSRCKLAKHLYATQTNPLYKIYLHKVYCSEQGFNFLVLGLICFRHNSFWFSSPQYVYQEPMVRFIISFDNDIVQENSESHIGVTSILRKYILMKRNQHGIESLRFSNLNKLTSLMFSDDISIYECINSIYVN